MLGRRSMVAGLTGGADAGRQPQHIAIVMDGNGRWAQSRGKPRRAGHQAGVKVARAMVEACGERRIPALTLFAFSSENWKRPETEVRGLMELFLRAIDREVDSLHKNEVEVRFIGDRTRFGGDLAQRMARAESLTAGNAGLQLRVAVNYGGRWDIARAARSLARDVAAGKRSPADIDETAMGEAMLLSELPPVDLLIRTGGEFRVSNFLLWQLAYSELYFSDVLWPDFDADALDTAIKTFAARERRFGNVAVA